MTKSWLAGTTAALLLAIPARAPAQSAFRVTGTPHVVRHVVDTIALTYIHGPCIAGHDRFARGVHRRCAGSPQRRSPRLTGRLARARLDSVVNERISDTSAVYDTLIVVEGAHGSTIGVVALPPDTSNAGLGARLVRMRRPTRGRSNVD